MHHDGEGMFEVFLSGNKLVLRIIGLKLESLRARRAWQSHFAEELIIV